MGAPVTGIKLATPGAINPPKHVIKGEVVEARTHHTGKYVILEIRHGKRTPEPKKTKKDPCCVGSYDDRPSMSFPVPKKVAKDYPIGSMVYIGLKPAPGSSDEDDE